MPFRENGTRIGIIAPVFVGSFVASLVEFPDDSASILDEVPDKARDKGHREPG
jgi:hypothetical protein